MKIIETTIYVCDHCKKKQYRKGDMTLHEKWCKKNPANKHMCFEFCKHLIKSDRDYEGEEYGGTKTVFTCAKTGKEMYSFIAERRKLPVVSDGTSIRMPLECDLFETAHVSDIDFLDF